MWLKFYIASIAHHLGWAILVKLSHLLFQFDSTYTATVLQLYCTMQLQWLRWQLLLVVRHR